MINKFIGISKTLQEERQLQEQRIIRTDELLKMEQESEILREQIDTLQQELQKEYQLGEEYRQELQHVHSEMFLLNQELQHTFSIERLELDEAKQFAQKILSTRQLTSESFAQLLSAIYGVVVTADHLEPLSSSPVKPPLAV